MLNYDSSILMWGVYISDMFVVSTDCLVHFNPCFYLKGQLQGIFSIAVTHIKRSSFLELGWQVIDLQYILVG
jgi:hypothetical protein